MVKEDLFIIEKDNLIMKYSNYLNSEIFVNNFKTVLNKILISYDCKFGYINEGSHKNGHVKIKINRYTREKELEMKINKNDNVAGKIYTIIHELTHLHNNHMSSKILTKKQAEVVADTVAMIVINNLKLENLLKASEVANKWNVLEYSNNYIKNMACSDKRKKVIFNQIEETIIYLKEEFEC